jgi:hypothetical protein
MNENIPAERRNGRFAGPAGLVKSIAWLLLTQVAARELSRAEIRARVLGHLQAHGRTPTATLWHLFEIDPPVDPDTLRVDRSKRWVSYAKLRSTLDRLQEAGVITKEHSSETGRKQAFWSLSASSNRAA